MIQRREQLRFTFEPSEALRIPGDEFRQNLDCNVAIQLRIAGAIHFAHPARAEGGEDFVRPRGEYRAAVSRLRVSGLYPSEFRHLQKLASEFELSSPRNRRPQVTLEPRRCGWPSRRPLILADSPAFTG